MTSIFWQNSKSYNIPPSCTNITYMYMVYIDLSNDDTNAIRFHSNITSYYMKLLVTMAAIIGDTVPVHVLKVKSR